jgi:hypothetical protein
MSTDPTPHLLEQEEDTPNIRLVLFIAGGTAAVFAIGIGWVAMMMHGNPRAGHLSAPYPKSLGRPEIGIVDQPMFEGDRRRAELMSSQRKRLSEYGWVDRDKGIIHIPISQAMARVAARGSVR